MLISSDYKNLNEKLHKANPLYGMSGCHLAKDIYKLSLELNTKDILDYGCGKSTLSENLPFAIKQYGPAILKYAQEKELSDIVVCSDVMEHIEPDALDDVLRDIEYLTKKTAYFVISCRPAKKTLEDGRNAHLIIESPEWWIDKISNYFKIRTATGNKDEVKIICKKN